MRRETHTHTHSHTKKKMHVVKRLADFMMGDIWNSLDGFCIFREVRSFKKKKQKIYAYIMPIISRNSANDLTQRARELPLHKENTQSSRKIFLNEYILKCILIYL